MSKQGGALTSRFWKVPESSNLEAKLTQCGFAFLTATHPSSQLQAHLPSRASPPLSTSANTLHTCRLARTCAPSHCSRADPGQSSVGDAIFGKYLLLPQACTGPRFQTSLHRVLPASSCILSRPSSGLTLLCAGFSPAAVSWRGPLLPTQLPLCCPTSGMATVRHCYGMRHLCLSQMLGDILVLRTPCCPRWILNQYHTSVSHVLR